MRKTRKDQTSKEPSRRRHVVRAGGSGKLLLELFNLHVFTDIGLQLSPRAPRSRKQAALDT